MKKCISHVNMPANNLEDSTDWYVKYLGCTFIADFGDFAILELEEGPGIYLRLTGDRTANTFTVEGIPFPTIAIEVEGIEDIVKAIKESGTNYEGDGEIDQDEEGRKSFRFYDPTGNMIEVHEEPKEA